MKIREASCGRLEASETWEKVDASSRKGKLAELSYKECFRAVLLPESRQPTEPEADYSACLKTAQISETVETNEKLVSMTKKERAELKKKTGWSSEIVDAICFKEEAEIYQNASLQESVVDGHKCLVKKDLDADWVDEFGSSNLERMGDGNAPFINEDRIELHHIGQKDDAPLAELTTEEHRGRGNDAILHNKTQESEINRGAFSVARLKHWRARARQIKTERGN